MAKVEVTTCDGCGIPAAKSSSGHIFTAGCGWYRLLGVVDDGHYKDIDACSDECLAVAVSKLTGWTFCDERGVAVGVDPLEELFTAPAAVKSRAPRKPKPRT